MLSFSLPKHVAIVMDGNGRWAKKRHMLRTTGHKAGGDVARKIIQFAAEKGIKVLTLFAFGRENWRRPESEVSFLMELFLTTLNRETKELYENNICIRFIGDRAAFSQKLQGKMQAAENLTAENTGLTLVIAVNYSGQWDIFQAAKKFTQQAQDARVLPDELTLEDFSQHLCLHDLPEPDLFIRTSGECRISNFLLWQLAYTELYFTDVLWPDFTVEEFQAALNFFQTRERRFGYTSEQLQGEKKHA